MSSVQPRLPPGVSFALRERFAGVEASRDPRKWLARRDPTAFLWSKQMEVVEACFTHDRVAVRSCHSSGKSFTAGELAVMWIDCHPPGDAFVLTTAPTNDQVKAILWKEIGRAHSRVGAPGSLNQREWWLGKEIVAMGRKPNDYDPTSFQGVHALHVLVILDEACGIPEALWEAADSLASNEGSCILAIGNPDDPTSHFRTVCEPKSLWHKLRIRAEDTPNFTGEEVPARVRKMLLSQRWVERKAQEWGTASPLYVSKVMAEFPTNSPDALVPVGWLHAAFDKWDDAKPAQRRIPGGRLGVDVGRGGDGETVFYYASPSHGDVSFCHVTHFASGDDTHTTSLHAQRCTIEHETTVANVDGDGLGAGVYDNLNAWGVGAHECRGGMSAERDDRFSNHRSEWYWNLRESLRDGKLAIERDEVLEVQLTQIKWGLDGKGRVRVETKDEMRSRGLPSPDRADALVYSQVEPPVKKKSVVAGPGGAPQASRWKR